MQIRFAIALSACALLGACASTPSAPETPKVFNKKGGVQFLGGSASWDEDEVIGPLVAMGETSDGSWRGNIVGTAIDVSIYDGRAAGSYLVMKWKDEGDHRVITAQLNGRLHRFEMYPDRIEVRGPVRSFTLHKNGPTGWGPGGELQFEGEATAAMPPMPQFGFAMLATFAAAESGGRGGTDPSMPNTGTRQ